MAKQKAPVTRSRTAPIAPSTALAPLGAMVPVVFIAPDNPGGVVDTAAPDGYTITEEAPSTLTPAAHWDNPGQFFVGEYQGQRLDVGPNKSRIYNFKVEGEHVSVWGSTILDERMDRLNPKPGEHIFVRYLGDVETKRGMNPAKAFRVARVAKA